MVYFVSILAELFGKCRRFVWSGEESGLFHNKNLLHLLEHQFDYNLFRICFFWSFTYKNAMLITISLTYFAHLGFDSFWFLAAHQENKSVQCIYP